VTTERSGGVVVQLDETSLLPPPEPTVPWASLPFVIVGVTHGDVDDGWQDICDVMVDADDPALASIEANLADHPLTAITLALLMRTQANLPPAEALVAESAAYSVLQSGPEFAAWRAAHPPRTPADDDDGPRVQVDRLEHTLAVTLTRPQRLNALDSRLRDELVAALAVAAADPSITRVELKGEGDAFCAGGDLDEFGSRPDPATAHVVRLQRSPARVLSRLAVPTVAYVHGATVGSGIELAAACDWVVAAPDTRLALPEIALGLVPGAGGTVSLPHRIGRQRTAWLAFSGCTIDVQTALDWGLVDEVEADTPSA
jgi:enoyl-CoA hydratase/carnithine racemase